MAILRRTLPKRVLLISYFANFGEVKVFKGNFCLKRSQLVKIKLGSVRLWLRAALMIILIFIEITFSRKRFSKRILKHYKTTLNIGASIDNM